MVLDDILDIEIGRGAFGTVYSKRNDPSLCIKVSNKTKGASSVSCRQWSNEYEKIKAFMNRIGKKTNTNIFKMVRIVQPSEFIETPESCYMVLPRIFRPEGKSFVAPTIQAQLGIRSGRMIHKGRGEFIGLKEIKEYVSEKDINIASYELGMMMALIHVVGKNDAYDVELFLGIEAHTKKCRFYLADFDLSEEIKTFDDETIQRMTWSLDAIPYFPQESLDPKLFKLFKSGYNKIANNDELVNKVFENYS
jgi:hypothetical protein